MEVRFPGIGPKLAKIRSRRCKRAKKEDVELLYWTAASWGSAISLGVDKPELVIDLPTVRALAERALALDETWSKGAHPRDDDLARQPARGARRLAGARARALQARGRDSEGPVAGPYVALALGVSVPAQNVEEFEKLLGTALAIDPKENPRTLLVTLVTQRRARALLDQIDTLFVK